MRCLPVSLALNCPPFTGVLREIARHECVEEIVICELDQGVIDVSKKYLPSLAKGYDDPRVTVHVMDGAVFMEQNKDYFDVIITDSSDPIGPANVLFETPFYRAMHGALREGGIVCTQGECMWLHLDLIKPLVDSISQTFSSVEYAYTTIPTYPSGQIGFIIATKGRTTCKKPEREASAELLADLKYYTPELHAASFVLPAFAGRAIFGDDAREESGRSSDRSGEDEDSFFGDDADGARGGEGSSRHEDFSECQA